MIRPYIISASIIIRLFLFNVSNAQVSQKVEIGGGLGFFNYTGDIVRTYDLLTARPAATLFHRSNISRILSIRSSFTAGQLAASDAYSKTDAFAIKRNASFDIFLFELSSVFEYHFLDWRDSKKRIRFTPYFFTGAGLFGMSGIPSKSEEYSNIQICIPMGGGIKYVLNPRYYISFELGVRKTFFDNLDNISTGTISQKNYQYGFTSDNDNYFFTVISLTYTLYDIPCLSSNTYR